MIIRKAKEQDLPSIVKMLSDDKLGEVRETYQEPLPMVYHDAYKRIRADDNQWLIVIEDLENDIVGTMQLSFIQYLTYKGGIRAQIEAVRVRKDQRGRKIGERLIQWGIQKAMDMGAHVVQLTTDKERDKALQFYERLGFNATHHGMKIHI